MTRAQQSAHNRQIIQTLITLVKHQSRLPDYNSVVVHLNNQAMFSSRGNPWTRKSVFRMLQRNGYSGLHGLRQSSYRLSKDLGLAAG